MIKTSSQLKAKVRNLSGGDTQRAQTLIRTFVMERFLERVSLSKYRDRFILKGGMLVAAVTGMDMRATMDIDTTTKALPLNAQDAERIVKEIADIEIEDGVSFRITKVSDIMEEHEYPGIRIMLEANLDRLRQAIKIDISTGDVITPGAIEFSYKLMFEDRSISLMAYNIETLLAEKMETILSRGIANTRMRDFYDIYILTEQNMEIDDAILSEALIAVCNKRRSEAYISSASEILDDIESNELVKTEWERYRKNNFYVGDLEFGEVMSGVRRIFRRCGIVV
ncbi:MAG: nucleotidyl transferase AbiEii/AbiGii toxin family protein [Oscillospiraceae bacterium]|nr:nucleotidyl transferase AbiEii/AbiGii toxin family protein [Oscillospiraceae bacterium]